MSILDAISSHYADQTIRIEVPEWRDVATLPEVIYSRPYTLYDERSMKQFARDDNPDGFAEVVVRKAVDEKGARLFADGDRPALVRVCPAAVLKRIATAIIASAPSVEDALGNSERT